VTILVALWGHSSIGQILHVSATQVLDRAPLNLSTIDSMSINYSFRTYRYRMAKLKEKPRISTSDSKGVFGQRGKTPRVGLYARVSTHDQQTLPMQMSAMRDYAKKRRWAIAVEVKDVGSGATTRPEREKFGGWIAGGGRWWTW
jgi:predicted site-specific integrase-resolvase